jgi:hypothetical protein
MAQDDGISLIAAPHPCRRSFLGLLASMPFVGQFIGHSEATSISPDSIVAVEIDIPTYAEAGEVVTCENGHPICEFIETVAWGQIQDVERQLGRWHQEKPEVGQLPLPVCAICSASFTDGMRYHFGDGWRDHREAGLKVTERIGHGKRA